MLGRNLFFICLFRVSFAINVWSTGYNSCGRRLIPCDNSQCIRRNWWCDGDMDCRDGSDEFYCNREGRINTCDPERHFSCINKMCIPKALKCDGYDDCKDFSDEEQCDSEFSGNFDYSNNFDLSTTESRDFYETELLNTETTYLEYYTEMPMTTQDYFTSTELSDTETMTYLVETDAPSTTPLPQNPSRHRVPGFVSRALEPSYKFFDENGPNSNTGSMKPGSHIFPSRESSPTSHKSPYPRYPPALPRNYLDISINIPFGQRVQARGEPRVNDPYASQNQDVRTYPGCLKSESPDDDFERRYERFLADHQYKNFRMADEGMSSRHASHRQREDIPRSLVALFVITDSSPVNIQVNR